MPAERRSFYDILAPIIYWDATFAIAGLEERELFHAECDAFARRLESEFVLSVTQAFRLMRAYSLLPTDAFHIAIALDAGIRSFASLDADFLRVDGIVVYTCVP